MSGVLLHSVRATGSGGASNWRTKMMIDDNCQMALSTGFIATICNGECLNWVYVKLTNYVDENAS